MALSLDRHWMTCHSRAVTSALPQGRPSTPPSAKCRPAPPVPPADPKGGNIPTTAAPPVPPFTEIHSAFPPSRPSRRGCRLGQVLLVYRPQSRQHHHVHLESS